MSGNKMALDALMACVAAIERTQHCTLEDRLAASDKARAAIAALQAEEVERLAAQAAPTEAEALRHLMGMGEAEIDAELLTSGIDPDDAVKRAVRAIDGALAIKAERRAIMYGDIVHNHVCAMRAAVVASHLESPEAGMRWIVNTLFGPGHLPDVDEAIELGGAQAMFDKEMAEHEAFRAAHPAPVAAQPSQAPVVQAVQTEVRFKYESMKPIDGYDAIYAEYATTFGRYPDDFMSKVVRQTKEDLFMWWGAHREKIRAGLVLLAAQEDASSGATTQAVRMLTREELNDVALSEQVGWGPGEYVEAVQLALLRVNAGRTIPADGKIGGAA